MNDMAREAFTNQLVLIEDYPVQPASVTPAQAGVQIADSRIPAFAGMTMFTICCSP